MAIVAIAVNLFLVFLYFDFSFMFWNSLNDELTRNGLGVTWNPLHGGVYYYGSTGIDSGIGLFLDFPFYVFLFSVFLNIVLILKLLNSNVTKENP